MQHNRSETPAYVIWVEARPTSKGKGKSVYYEAVEQAAKRAIVSPIGAGDIELDVAYSTTTPLAIRLDVDNVNKPTLDALKGIAYADDSQVRSVRTTIFDRSADPEIHGQVEHMGRLFYSPHDHVVLIRVYSDSRLADLGGEREVQRRRYEGWQRDFDAALTAVRDKRTRPTNQTK